MVEDAVLERLMIFLDKRGITYEVWVEEEISPYPLSEVAEALGTSEEAVVKVVLLKVQDSFIKVVLPAHWLIDYLDTQNSCATKYKTVAQTGLYILYGYLNCRISPSNRGPNSCWPVSIMEQVLSKRILMARWTSFFIRLTKWKCPFESILSLFC